MYLAGFKSLSEVVFCRVWDGLAASVLQQTGQNLPQTDRATAARELAEKVTDFMVSSQPQATVDTASSEANLLKTQIELLQQQLTGFQQASSGAPATSPTETTTPADAAPPSQPAVPLPTVHESSNEPSTGDHAAMVKGPDGTMGAPSCKSKAPRMSSTLCFMRFRKQYLPPKGFLKLWSPLPAGVRREKPTKTATMRTQRQRWSMEQNVMLKPL